ncbi:glucosaminidase domain-containing protein [Hyphomicrobium sp. LHD-15]|uniref:glucosaminidase domain-containing protein n=1 Tax=Hyphomicrobium sp. LHD-15 TaxID=3072142 RepID=UPI00280F314D|nr:glucosaminidase domain-containing protein [Hyphomicrobium sp. LHD-15]MDQ8699450.1 glucosaminidase domain-containing protein [Hyphomicrobium sp. LHD-15]
MITVGWGQMSMTRSRSMVLGLALVAGLGASAAGASPNLPEIRTSRQNIVPACVTPERLMAFLQRRNGNLSPRFRDIASHYKRHGEAWGVRWDYAFFQMAIETNFLTYRAPSGRMGDVDPKQNNFAGIGTTGGGVPGDSFPDVSTGVLGQIQHLVVYSGEMIPKPVAPRTQLKQEHILEKSRELKRPVRFSDLARRWAADPKYAGSIEWVAQQFRTQYCPANGRPQQMAPQEIEVLPWQDKPPAHAKGRDRASLPAPPAQDAASPVRTVWSRDQKGAPEATAKTAKAPDVKQPPAKKSTVSIAKVQPVQRVQPVAVAAAAGPVQDARAARAPTGAVVEGAPGEPVATLPARDSTEGNVTVDQPSGEPESSFALFTPPAALASATLPSASPRTVATRQADAHQTQGGQVPSDQAAASNDQGSAEIGRELAGPPAPPATSVAASTAMGPPVAALTSDRPAAPPAETEAPGPLASLLGGGNGAASKPAFDPPSGLGVKPGRCVVETARYGGDTTVLVKAQQGAKVHYIALSVIDGFEDSMTKSFLSSRGEGGEVLGTFPSRDQALAQAKTLCPG